MTSREGDPRRWDVPAGPATGIDRSTPWSTPRLPADSMSSGKIVPVQPAAMPRVSRITQISQFSRRGRRNAPVKNSRSSGSAPRPQQRGRLRAHRSRRQQQGPRRRRLRQESSRRAHPGLTMPGHTPRRAPHPPAAPTPGGRQPGQAATPATLITPAAAARVRQLAAQAEHCRAIARPLRCRTGRRRNADRCPGRDERPGGRRGPRSGPPAKVETKAKVVDAPACKHLPGFFTPR
jgi:hypothetical protein